MNLDRRGSVRARNSVVIAVSPKAAADMFPHRIFSRLNNLSLLGMGTIALVVVALIYFTYWNTSQGISSGSLTIASSDPNGIWKYGCTADARAPVLIHVETKLGVNYNAGHWFHMSELIMTQHAALRKSGALANASAVYVNFDKGQELLLCEAFLSVFH